MKLYTNKNLFVEYPLLMVVRDFINSSVLINTLTLLTPCHPSDRRHDRDGDWLKLVPGSGWPWVKGVFLVRNDRGLRVACRLCVWQNPYRWLVAPVVSLVLSCLLDVSTRSWNFPGDPVSGGVRGGARSRVVQGHHLTQNFTEYWNLYWNVSLKNNPARTSKKEK